MTLDKNPSIWILLPCYKRPDYTIQCLTSLVKAQEYNQNVMFYMVDDGSCDGTDGLLKSCDIPNKRVIIHNDNKGLRSSILEFFKAAQTEKPDIIGIIGNDTILFKNWLDKTIDMLFNTDLDVVSPNYMPSNPAFTQGIECGKPYRLAKDIVGLWFMDRRLLDGISFEELDLWGIKGSINLLKQIKHEKSPKIGWIPEVLCLDLGHHSGLAPGHIKTKEHEEYSKEIGRSVSWQSE